MEDLIGKVLTWKPNKNIMLKDKNKYQKNRHKVKIRGGMCIGENK